MDKKGSLTIIAIILAVIVLVMIVAYFGQRECSNNQECLDDSYCGSDYECHKYPDKIIVTQNNFLPAAIVLGLSLIISAYIFRKGRVPFKKNPPLG